MKKLFLIAAVLIFTGCAGSTSQYYEGSKRLLKLAPPRIRQSLKRYLRSQQAVTGRRLVQRSWLWH